MSTGELPVNYQVRSVSMVPEDVEYAVRNTETYLRCLQRASISLPGLRVLELGPGVNFSSLLVMASMGAQVVAADRFMTGWTAEYHPAFYRAFKEAWGSNLPAIDRVLADGEHSPGVVEMHRESAEEMRGIASGSIDLVISNAVLEHVYSTPDVCRELARITRTGGRGMHQIDFRDHRDFNSPLEFLTMPDDEFAREFEIRNAECGNRVRASETQASFEASGFRLLDFEINHRPRPEYLADLLPRLRSSTSHYRRWPRADLEITGGRMLLERIAL